MITEIEKANLADSICHSYADRNGVSFTIQLNQITVLVKKAESENNTQLCDELMFLADIVISTEHLVRC